MVIGAWLRGLGLERYEEAFRNNEIDQRILPELTADDLKELGVGAIGHRRLLLKAIADLPSGDGRAATAGSPAAPASFAVAEAERRQLTVIFCDLVGSTALSARFDPEDLREIVGAYHRAVADTAGRFAGFVAKYMGDGVLIYFGYPQAHEDDAERAVRAGLAVIGGGRASRCSRTLGGAAGHRQRARRRRRPDRRGRGAGARLGFAPSLNSLPDGYKAQQQASENQSFSAGNGVRFQKVEQVG